MCDIEQRRNRGILGRQFVNRQNLHTTHVTSVASAMSVQRVRGNSRAAPPIAVSSIMGEFYQNPFVSFVSLCLDGPAALDRGSSGAFARKGASTRFRGVDRFSKGVRCTERTGTWRRSGRPLKLKSGEPRQGRKAATVADIFRVQGSPSGEPAARSDCPPRRSKRGCAA